MSATASTHYPVIQGITVLGATGTIGVNTLDVLARHPDKFRLVAISAHQNTERLFEQCQQWAPQYAVISDEQAAAGFALRLREAGLSTELLTGVKGLCAVCELAETDAVMAGIVGGAGLEPTLAAARAGKRVLLANKEALVMSGSLFMDAVRDNNAVLLPIDSEHNAIFQCMPAGHSRNLAENGVEKILLTGSGGPFRTLPLDQFPQVTPDQACAHPNWVMGRKISVDSATMMNKGLEIIEAHWLFGAPLDRIQVVIHPQSVIHSMVSYADGSVLAQLGNPDMRTPIAHALSWPNRIESGVAPLDMFEVGRLDFEVPDMTRFPCLRLAQEACAAGGGASTVLNAANELAVAQFLEHKIPFPGIPATIEHCLGKLPGGQADSLDSILELDQAARIEAQHFIADRYNGDITT